LLGRKYSSPVSYPFDLPTGIQNELFCRMMLGEKVQFNKPAKLVQVFRMINEYGKDEKSFSARKDKLVWKDILSKNGYVADGVLYLPASVQIDKKFGNCDLITIEDECDLIPRNEWKIINGNYEKGNSHCFNLHHPSQYEIFRFHKDPPELSLYYRYWYVGDPTRDHFTIAVLEKDKPVEIKINGKIDSARGRYFKEQYYIFQLLGEFDGSVILKENTDAVMKKIPAERKLVDLLKPLW
jgi:hypothetical protein